MPRTLMDNRCNFISRERKMEGYYLSFFFFFSRIIRWDAIEAPPQVEVGGHLIALLGLPLCMWLLTPDAWHLFSLTAHSPRQDECLHATWASTMCDQHIWGNECQNHVIMYIHQRRVGEGDGEPIHTMISLLDDCSPASKEPMYMLFRPSRAGGGSR